MPLYMPDYSEYKNNALILQKIALTHLDCSRWFINGQKDVYQDLTCWSAPCSLTGCRDRSKMRASVTMSIGDWRLPCLQVVKSSVRISGLSVASVNPAITSSRVAGGAKHGEVWGRGWERERTVRVNPLHLDCFWSWSTFLTDSL